MVPGLSAQDLAALEAAPLPSTAADRALAAVADFASLKMPVNVQMSNTTVAQVHFDQSVLKLATAIKSLADGMHNLERRQDDGDRLVQELKEHVKGVEERTITLKSEQMAVVAAAKKALRTSKQQTDFLEFDKCIDPRSRVGSVPRSSNSSTVEVRLQQVEKKVAALLQWQEDEGVKSVGQIVGRNFGGRMTEDVRGSLQMSVSYIQKNCAMIQALQESVAQLEESANSKISDQAAVEIHQLWRHIQDNYYSRHQLDPLLDSLEAKASIRHGGEYAQKVAPRLQQGGDSLGSLASYGQGNRLQGVEARMERHEARLDKSIVDLADRLDPIQDFVEQQRLSSWQKGRQLPDVAQKLDQLWAQCQYYFSKVKEHDVHFSFFRTSFESHKQHCLDLADPTPSGQRSESIFPSSWKEELNAEAATAGELKVPPGHGSIFEPSRGGR